MFSKTAIVLLVILLINDLVPVSLRGGRGGGGGGGRGGGRGRGGRGGRWGARGRHHKGQLAAAGIAYYGGARRHVGNPDGSDGDGRSGREVRQAESTSNEQKNDSMGVLSSANFRILIVCLIIGVMVFVAIVIICNFCCRNYSMKKEKVAGGTPDEHVIFIPMEDDDDDDIKKPLPSDDEGETNEKAMLLNKSYDSMPPLEPEYEAPNLPKQQQHHQDSPPPPYEVQSDESTPSPQDDSNAHNRDTVPLVGAMMVPLDNIDEDIDGEMCHAHHGYLTPLSNASRQTSPSRSLHSDQSTETSDQTLPRLSESDNSDAEVISVDVHSTEPFDEGDEDKNEDARLQQNQEPETDPVTQPGTDSKQLYPSLSGEEELAKPEELPQSDPHPETIILQEPTAPSQEPLGTDVSVKPEPSVPELKVEQPAASKTFPVVVEPKSVAEEEKEEQGKEEAEVQKDEMPSIEHESNTREVPSIAIIPSAESATLNEDPPVKKDEHIVKEETNGPTSQLDSSNALPTSAENVSTESVEPSDVKDDPKNESDQNKSVSLENPAVLPVISQTERQPKDNSITEDNNVTENAEPETDAVSDPPEEPSKADAPMVAVSELSDSSVTQTESKAEQENKDDRDLVEKEEVQNDENNEVDTEKTEDKPQKLESDDAKIKAVKGNDDINDEPDTTESDLPAKERKEETDPVNPQQDKVDDEDKASEAIPSDHTPENSEEIEAQIEEPMEKSEEVPESVGKTVEPKQDSESTEIPPQSEDIPPTQGAAASSPSVDIEVPNESTEVSVPPDAHDAENSPNSQKVSEHAQSIQDSKQSDQTQPSAEKS